MNRQSKYIAAIVLTLALLLPIPASAGDREWTEKDTTLQVVTTALLVVDWAQTRGGVKSGPYSFYETNAYLGRYPSARKVDTYFASSIILDAIISYALPVPYRTYWQVSNITLEVSTVYGNYTLGVKMNF